MDSRINLDKRQLSLLLSNLIITKMIFAYPRFLFKTSGNAAWIQAIYMSLFAYALLLVSFSFFRRSGNRSVLQLAESIGKLPLKIVVAFIVGAIIAVNAATEIRTFAESVKIILLPKTKIEIIMALFAVTVIIGARCGLGALSTINALFFPICLFALLAMTVALIPAYDINRLLPILGKGSESIFIKGLGDMYGFSDIIALNLLLPYCGDIKTVKKSGTRAVLLGGGVLVILSLAYAMTYPYPYSEEFLLIPYQLSRMVRIGEYFQRFEALFELVWTMTQLLYTAIYVCLLAEVITTSFKLSHAKSIIPCSVCLLSLLSFLPSSVVSLLDISSQVKMYLAIPAYLLPIVIPLIYILLRKKGDTK